MAAENWTFWLNMTNLALGVVTLLALLVVFAALGWDLAVQWLHKTRQSDAVDLRRVDMNRFVADLHKQWTEPHSLSVPELGLTMADGGEKVEPSDPDASAKKRK